MNVQVGTHVHIEYIIGFVTRAFRGRLLMWFLPRHTDAYMRAPCMRARE